jgi:hypothetical protein
MKTHRATPTARVPSPRVKAMAQARPQREQGRGRRQPAPQVEHGPLQELARERRRRRRQPGLAVEHVEVAQAIQEIADHHGAEGDPEEGGRARVGVARPERALDEGLRFGGHGRAAMLRRALAGGDVGGGSTECEEGARASR